MKKSLLVLMIAVLLPSLVLGWLALRSAEEQQIILERRTAELNQKETEAVAASARALIDDQRRAFAETVARLLSDGRASEVAANFTQTLASAWPQKAVGFAIGAEGRLLCPTARDASTRPEAQQFLWDNGTFLGNKVVATVYPVDVEELNRAQSYGKKRAASQTPMLSKAAPPQAQQGQKQEADATGGMLVMRDRGAMTEQALRNVAPQQSFETQSAAASQISAATGSFHELIGDADEGMINRFVQDRLNMIFWVRPTAARDLIFGCMIEAEDLRDLWSAALPEEDGSYGGGVARQEFILAVLDDKARPVAVQPANVTGIDWKRPFVASAIGEALPHWEAALYLRDPQQLQNSARGMRRTLYLLIAAALGAIAVGGFVVAADTRRQLMLAQKKTDFVSNVSHELKTPLTSIRMFAELMQNGPIEAVKQQQYLRIISVEAERLTRLINNVLDFARIERREKSLRKTSADLHAVIARVWEGQELHLRAAGFTTRWEAAPPPYPVLVDEDAITQVLMNLLSNAEKYSGARKEVELHSYCDNGRVCVSVLDRGCGVPAGEETKIFESFYRSHDSLADAPSGTGLGLTLAQRLVREHGGEINFSPRPGGGSNFTMTLPLAEKPARL